MKKVLLKKHDGVVAVCDPDLIGKSFSEGNIQLEVSERFYKGEEKEEEEVTRVLQDCMNANIVGSESVRIGLKSGAISKEHILSVQGVPHAQKVVIIP